MWRRQIFLTFSPFDLQLNDKTVAKNYKLLISWPFLFFFSFGINDARFARRNSAVINEYGNSRDNELRRIW